MSLSDAPVRATVAVSDMERAAAFYEGVLGLEPPPAGSTGPMVRIYACGAGSRLQIYVSEHAGTGTATVASWSVDDFDAVVDGLLAAGATLERYDGMEADERGVHAFGSHRVAWIADPDGNVLSLDNGASG